MRTEMITYNAKRWRDGQIVHAVETETVPADADRCTVSLDDSRWFGAPWQVTRCIGRRGHTGACHGIDASGGAAFPFTRGNRYVPVPLTARPDVTTYRGRSAVRMAWNRAFAGTYDAVGFGDLYGVQRRGRVWEVWFHERREDNYGGGWHFGRIAGTFPTMREAMSFADRHNRLRSFWL